MTSSDRISAGVPAGTGIASPDHRYLAGLVLLATVLRLFFLGHQSLWIDEVSTLIVATPKPDYPIGQLLAYNIHGPLYTFVVYLFRFFGENETWLRLPSAAAGVGGVVCLYLWVRIWMTERIGRIAAILLAVNPLHIRYSQEIRGYAFVFFFGVAACYFIERIRNDPSWRTGLVYAVSMAAAALSSFTAGLLYAAHVVLWALRGGFRPRPFLRWATLSLVILVLISPWVYRVYTYIDVGKLVTPIAPGELADQDRLRGETTFAPASLPYAFYVYSVGFTLGPPLAELHENADLAVVMKRYGGTIIWVAILFGSLALYGIVMAIRRRFRWLELAAYILVPLALTIALNWQNAKAFNVRYVMFGLPAWLTLVAIALDSLRSRWRTVMAILVAVTTAVSLGNHYFSGRFAREDVRTAVRYLEEQPDVTCIFAPTVYNVVTHYYHGPAAIHVVYRRTAPSDQVERQLEDVFAACNTLWYVRARPWVSDGDGYILKRLLERFDMLERVEFNGIELFRYEVKKEP